MNPLTYLFGVLLCLASATLSVLGVNMQKKAHLVLAAAGPEDKKPYIRSPLWWCGMLGVILGAILDLMSLGFAPQTVVAAFGSLTLVINCWTAPVFLGEQISRHELISTCAITLGAVAVVANASHSAEDENLDTILSRFSDTVVIVYGALIGAICLFLTIAFRVLDGRSAQTLPYSRRLHAISVAALSGVLGAQSLLFAKAFMLIVKQGIKGGNSKSPFARWQTYPIAVMMFSCVLLQTHTLNLGLARFDAVFFLPLFQVFWIVMGVIGAGVFYKEFSHITAFQAVLLNLGVVVIAFGIFWLARLHMRRKKEMNVVPGRESPRTGRSFFSHSGFPILDTHWHHVYERNGPNRGTRSHSADLGDISRQLYNENNYDSNSGTLTTPREVVIPLEKTPTKGMSHSLPMRHSEDEGTFYRLD